MWKSKIFQAFFKQYWPHFLVLLPVSPARSVVLFFVAAAIHLLGCLVLYDHAEIYQVYAPAAPICSLQSVYFYFFSSLKI